MTPYTPPFLNPHDALGPSFGFAPPAFPDQRRRSIANGEIAAVGNVARSVATFPYATMPPPTSGGYPMSMGVSDPQPNLARRRASAISTQNLIPRRLHSMAGPYARYTPILGAPMPGSPSQGRRTSSQYLPSPSGRIRPETYPRQMSIGDSSKRPVQRLVSQHDLYGSFQEEHNELAPPQALDMPVYGLPPVSNYSFGGPTPQVDAATPTRIRDRNQSIISLNLNIGSNTSPDFVPAPVESGPSSASASYGPNSASAMSMSMSISKSNSSSGSSQEIDADYYKAVDHDSSNDLFGGFIPDPPDPYQADFEAYAALCLSGVDEDA